MLSFTSRLSTNSEAFAVFVTEKYNYSNKRDILPKNTVQKINSFLSVLKIKKKEDDISSFDISDKQKCFIIKVKKSIKVIPPKKVVEVFSHI